MNSFVNVVTAFAIIIGMSCFGTYVTKYMEETEAREANKAFQFEQKASELAHCKAGTTNALIVQGVKCKGKW